MFSKFLKHSKGSMEGNKMYTRKIILGTKEGNNKVVGQQRKINCIEKLSKIWSLSVINNCIQYN